MQKILKLSKMLLAAILLVAVLSTSACAASYDATVLAKEMDVYAKPTSSSRYIGSLKQGKSITVLQLKGDWALVRRGDYIGYARLKDIMFDDAIEGIVTKKTKITYVTKSSYKKGISYEATASKGLHLYVVGFNGDYLLVTNKSGSVLGYIKESRVKKA